jgi:hypothetical protein
MFRQADRQKVTLLILKEESRRNFFKGFANYRRQPDDLCVLPGPAPLPDSPKNYRQQAISRHAGRSHLP